MPEVTLDAFRQRLESGQPVKGVLLLGSDSYLREKLRSLLIATFVPEPARAWAVARLFAADVALDEILQRAQSFPMLSSQQVIFVQGVESWESLNEIAREQTVKALAAYLEDPAPFTVLVLEAEKLDQRTRLFKLLSEHLLAVELSLGEDSEVPTVREMAGELGVELDLDAAALLADILNRDLAAIHTELLKLATFVGERRRITEADIDALVVSSKKYNVWQLAEILAERQRDRALVFLDTLLREGEQPPALVGAMAWMFRKLLEAQTLPSGTEAWQASRQLGMRRDAVELALRQARRIPREKLLAGLAALYEADSRLKKGSVDHRAVVEFLVARLTA
jgi:DNA polymerase-3 subunit delta